MSESIQVSISQDSVQQIIQAQVQAAVMAALRPHSDQFVKEMIEKSLLVVNEGSDRNRYASQGKKVTVLQEIVEKIIIEEATAAIKDWASGHREEIAKNIHTSINTNRFSKAFALQIVESMLKATAYNFKVEVTPVRPEDR